MPTVIKYIIRHIFLSCSITMLLAGCGTLQNGRGWGQDATLFPGFDRIRGAAVQAFYDPATWMPAAGAVVFSLGDLDERVSDWASDKTPIFGSHLTAERASDNLKTAAGVGVLLTALAAPSGPEPEVWVVSKLKGLGVEFAAGEATTGMTSVLKEWADRERPDGSDRRSLPSQHSSKAFSYATLGWRNVEHLPLSNGKKTFLRTGFTTLAIGTAWARIETEKHFPSDVLAGAALGSFITAFVHDAFLGLEVDKHLVLSVEPLKEGLMLGIHFSF